MALEGTLKDFPLPDIIQLLSLSRKTGAVEIAGSDGFGTGRLYFHQGKVVTATLNELPALDAAYAFFTFPGGSFRFNENELPAGTATPITISNEFLIIEGIRRADEWDKLRDRVPSLDLVLGLVADPVAGNRDINLKPDEWRVLTMINGRDSVRQIARRSQFGDFKTARIIYHLLTAGLIEPLGIVPSAPAAPPAEIPAPASAPQNGAGAADGGAIASHAVIRPLGAAPLPPITSAFGTPWAAPPTGGAPATATGPEPSTIRPLSGAPGGIPAARVPTAPVAGPPLYARLEAIAVAELGNTGRLMLSDAYKRMRLQPSTELTATTAGSLCDQFERGASMLVGSGRARSLSDTLRRAAAEFFSG